MKKQLLFLLLLVFNSSFAITTESKLNTAISYISSAIDDISSVRNSVIKMPVSPNLTIENVEEAMSSVVTELMIMAVGELPLSELVELQTGKKQRFLKVYQYAKPSYAVDWARYNPDLSVLLPHRITLVETNSGEFWLMALNMRSLINDYDSVPLNVKETLLQMNDSIMAIMSAGATGDF